MRKPVDVFTDGGLTDWQVNLALLKQALFVVQNNADDLHIPEEVMEAVYVIQTNLPLLGVGVEGYDDE